MVTSGLPSMCLFVPHPRHRGFGHLARCLALRQQYESIGGNAHIEFDSYPNEIANCIAVFDGIRPTYLKDDNALIVYIDDGLPLEDYRVDMVINQNSHIDAPFSDLSHLYGSLKCDKLIGFDYFMRRNDFDSVDVCDDGAIVLIPGSARTLREFPFISHLLTELSGCSIRELHALPFDTMAQEIASSHIVITACSVSALESCSLGKPTIVVQTADNQFYLHSALTYLGAALPYTRRNLFELLHSEESRQTLSNRARQYVPTDGAKRVVERIVKKAKEKGLCE